MRAAASGVAIQKIIIFIAFFAVFFPRLPRRYAPRNDDFCNDFEPCNNAETSSG
ncbi:MULTISPECIES: hypothetical protein [unclassified Rickettsia]|uniref:hypothetical protein n=1 Tax=unclassified Rickettsia TaxID=114295 RepID=UPI003132E75A